MSPKTLRSPTHDEFFGEEAHISSEIDELEDDNIQKNEIEPEDQDEYVWDWDDDGELILYKNVNFHSVKQNPTAERSKEVARPRQIAEILKHKTRNTRNQFKYLVRWADDLARPTWKVLDHQHYADDIKKYVSQLHTYSRNTLIARRREIAKLFSKN